MCLNDFMVGYANLSINFTSRNQIKGYDWVSKPSQGEKSKTKKLTLEVIFVTACC